MTFDLSIDAQRWRDHLDSVVANEPGIVPVIKGNGYGLGRNLLATESARLAVKQVAVGTVGEVAEALARFDGDVIVLTPWRPDAPRVCDPRVIHTVSRVCDVEALAADQPGARVLIEGGTSMSRHGMHRHELAAAAAALEGLTLEGFSIHLPMSPDNAAEAESWAAVLQTSQLNTSVLYVSHLSPAEAAQLAEDRPALSIRPRVGTRLWLGDLGALTVTATVQDVHGVSRGERVGYRQVKVPRDGHIVIVAGGTSHGVGLEAPRATAGIVTRGKTLAKGSLAAAGLTMSPFQIAGKTRWFIEPPHMQASMIFLPAGVEPPNVGQRLDVAVRYTTTTFDSITLR